LLTAFDLFWERPDLLLTALLEELLFELLRVAAGFEEEDFAFVAFDLLCLLLELFTCRELLFEDERLDTWEVLLLLLFSARDDLELCG
jgi:hypothetical protein